jgi:hypothetical protein
VVQNFRNIVKKLDKIFEKLNLNCGCYFIYGDQSIEICMWSFTNEAQSQSLISSVPHMSSGNTFLVSSLSCKQNKWYLICICTY